MTGRFAPTPSGRMHIGNVYAMLGAWLSARKSGDSIRLRIEDIDEPRVVPGAAELMMDDLHWLGLGWDDEPEFQSSRHALYQEALELLSKLSFDEISDIISTGFNDSKPCSTTAGNEAATSETTPLIYPCFCSRADIRAASAPQEGDRFTVYPGTCRRLIASEPQRAKQRLANNDRHSMRIATADTTITFHDEVFGTQQYNLAHDIGDIIVRRSDGIYSYQLAVTVDDLDMGITDITIVPEQEYPNGYFTTCSYPNPEIFDALKLGLDLATKTGADLMLATDPDADRVGISMKCPDGSYELVSGNEMGALLLDYICAGRIEKGTMPQAPVADQSIVSTPLADAIAGIGDQIANLEAAGEVDRFIFGFEESYGYLAGPYVRDKDAVIGSMLICEMAAYYRSIGSSIKQRLEEIYKEYGRYLNKVDSFEFPGLTGMEKMASIMQKLRDEPLTELAGHKVVKVTDYKKPEETGLPAANVLIYALDNGATVVVRPSGTEPKIKTYFTTLGKDLADAQAQKDALAAAIEPILA